MATDAILSPAAPAAPLRRAPGGPPDALPLSGRAPSGAAVRKAAEDFEAFFVTQAFAGMFEGVGTDGLFGGGAGETMWRSQLLQEYGRAAVRAGGVGIADAVGREMLRMQEAADAKTSGAAPAERG